MEREFVQWLAERVVPRDGVQVGIGDDAAVVDGGAAARVIATDLLCDRVHFVVGETDTRLIGRKALAVNLSDLAAMAAQPDMALVSLLWPRSLDWRLACEMYEGLMELADQFSVQLIGGDTNRWSGDLVVSVTLFGNATPRGVLTRSGAQVGDAILVTGDLGGSILGHHLTFQPRVVEALHWHANFPLHAGMDVSDGLLLDLHRLTVASGVGAELVLDDIPIAPAAHQLSRQSGRAALQHALSDGEDFELIITAACDVATRMLHQTGDCRLTRIGTITATTGLWHVDRDGQRHSLPHAGYLHT